MPESDLQNFEIPQEVKPPAPPGSKRDKLVVMLIPLVVFLVALTVLASLLAGRRSPPISISVTPPPQTPTPTPAPPVSIASTSAFYPMVASISALQNQLNNVDLKELPYAPPQIDLSVTFNQGQ